MRRLLILLFVALSGSAVADEYETVRAALLSAVPGLEIDTMEPSPIAGVISVTLPDGTVMQVAEDGKFFIYGDMYEINGSSMVNRSEYRRNLKRRELLANMDESQMLVFSPRKGETKATITVFTDVDCTYCRKLHQEVPELNRMGVEVRYLAYPRMGIQKPHTPSYKKMVSAWCAKNPQLALTQAKSGTKIEERVCVNPVDTQFALGEALGVNATPTILFEDGRLTPGFKTAAQLAITLGIN
jgi:thiol:disulfide interchange protein DsbC